MGRGEKPMGNREKAIGLDASKVSLLEMTQVRIENKRDVYSLTTKGRGEERKSLSAIKR